MRDHESAANRSISAAAAVTIFLVTAAAVLFFQLSGLTRMPSVRLDDRFVTQIFRAEPGALPGDGTLTGSDTENTADAGLAAGVSAGDRASSEPLRGGDRMTAAATLPSLTDPEGASVLCFGTRSSVVRILIDGKERAVFGEERRNAGRQIGDRLVFLPLSPEDAGKKIQVEITCAEGKTASVLTDVLLLRPEDAAKYPLIGHESKFMAMTALLLIAVMLFIFSLVSAVMRHRLSDSLLLAPALFLMSCAVYGKSHFFDLLICSEELRANAGIIAAYAAPAFFFFYLWRATAAHKRVRRSLYLLLAILLAGVFAGLTALFLTQGLHYAVFDPWLGYAVTGCLLFAVLAELFAGTKKGAEEDGLLRGGIFLSFVLFLIELARQNLWRLQESRTFGQYFPKTDYVAGAVFVLSCLLLLHQYRRYAKEVRSEENAALMERLAYTDILSGIPNRHYCDRKLSDISKHVSYTRTPVEYTVFMLNVDSMHEANEKFGYEAGNELIRCVAEAIHDAMRGCGADVRGDLDAVLYAQSAQAENEDGTGAEADENAVRAGETADCFFGRWGGDVFIACTFRSQADAFQTTFSSRIAAANIEKRLPLPVSVSIGSCDFRSGSHEAMLKAIGSAEREILDRRTQLT